MAQPANLTRREILQDAVPHEIRARLPGTAPLDPAQWILVDEAFAPQMAEREALLADRPRAVLACLPEARPAAEELLAEVLRALDARPDYQLGPDDRLGPDGRLRPDDRLGPDGRLRPDDRQGPDHRLGPSAGLFQGEVIRPDGTAVALAPARDPAPEAPLAVLGRLVQQDFCLMEKRGAEHVLTGAVLCFPASWTLAEKFDRPLGRIHVPVPSYDEMLARRVQRLFDGLQPGRPLWRANHLRYAAPALHAPVSEHAPPADRHPDDAPYIRSERQSLWRLPQSRAVAFGIHTVLVRA